MIVMPGPWLRAGGKGGAAENARWRHASEQKRASRRVVTNSVPQLEQARVCGGEAPAHNCSRLMPEVAGSVGPQRA
jgi:hypothetical protein